MDRRFVWGAMLLFCVGVDDCDMPTWELIPKRCERFTDAVADQFEACGFPSVEEQNVEIDCTDELFEQLRCMSVCVEDAPCSAFDGSDIDAVTRFSDCVLGCQ